MLFVHRYIVSYGSILSIMISYNIQVITGGNYDVDMELTGPSGRNLYKDTKKQYDSVTWTTDESGEYKFCFSNEFSTFTHKIVYFDFQVGDEPPVDGYNIDAHATAMTQVSNRAVFAYQ